MRPDPRIVAINGFLSVTMLIGTALHPTSSGIFFTAVFCALTLYGSVSLMRSRR